MPSSARVDTCGRFPSRSIDRAASRNASGASGSSCRSRTRSTFSRTISSGSDRGIGHDHPVAEPDDLLRIHPAHPQPREPVAEARRVVQGERPHDRRMREAALRPRQRRRGEHQPCDRRRLDRRLEHRDHAAHRVSGHHDAPGAQLGDEAGDDPSLVHQAGASSVARRPSEAREIEREDAAQARQTGGNLEPVEMRATQAVDQHERRVRRPLPGSISHRPVQIDGRKLGKVEAHEDEAYGSAGISAGQGAFLGKEPGEVVASERGPIGPSGTRMTRLHKTFTHPHLYICHHDALPYV